jgi:hypothetical protein
MLSQKIEILNGKVGLKIILKLMKKHLKSLLVKLKEIK